MSDAPRPPEGWTLYHSIAFLLVSGSCIDGKLDPDELGTIRGRLAQYPDLDGDPGPVLKAAAAHYEELRKNGAVMPALDRYCRRMTRALPEAARKVVLDDLIAVIGADGELHEHERAFLHAVYEHFGIQPPS